MNASRIVSVLLGEGNFDPKAMAYELGQTALGAPWLVARQAWDAEARAGYGDNPWRSVLYSLGYRDERAETIASVLYRLMHDVGYQPGGDPEDGDYPMSPEDVWPTAKQHIDSLNMPPEHVDAIKRIWMHLGDR